MACPLPCCWAKKNGAGYDPACCPTFCFAKQFGPGFDADFVVANKSAEKKGTILVIGTDKNQLTMQNGKIFNTGHNASEMFIPLLVLESAGFTFEFATAEGGKPFAVEEWSWAGPKAHKTEAALRAVRERTSGDGGDAGAGHANPMTTTAALERVTANKYKAIFFPGGHGTMIELGHPPDGGATGKILAHAHTKQLTTVTLCHGPESLLCAPKGTYDGYKVMGYPDKDDVGNNVKFGYLPGKPPLPLMREALTEKFPGMTFMNEEADTSTHVDRELITGAGPLAAHTVALAAVKALLGDAGTMGR